MKRIFSLMVVSLMLSCTTKKATEASVIAPTVYYYSTVAFVETPLNYIKGGIPLTKEEALQRNHYRFAYDQWNRLVTVAFYNGLTPREPNHTANLFTLAHRMEFSYGPKEEKVSFYNTKGQQINVLGDCREFVYSLNDKGFRSSLQFLNSGGDRVENDWGIFEYQWVYQTDGSIVEDRFNSIGEPVAIRPGFEFFRLRLYFNSLGHIALMQNIDESGNLIANSSGASQDRIMTNAQGNFLQWEVLDNKSALEKGNGPNVAIGIQAFNAYGYEIALEHRDENEELIYNAYGICKSKTQFDNFGNIVERRFYDEQDNPSGHKLAGYHKLKIQWDPTGNRRNTLSYFDVDDTPMQHQTRGYHKISYIYTNDNLLAQISYLDVKGNPVNRMDNGAAYIKYSYDGIGEGAEATLFDADGNSIP